MSSSKRPYKINPPFSGGSISFKQSSSLIPKGAQPSHSAKSQVPADVQELYAVFKNGDVHLAEVKALELIRKHPKSVSILEILGACAARQGEFSGAAEYCRKVLAIRPDYAAAYNNLGLALKNQGRWRDAAESFRRAAELTPDLSHAQNNLATCLKIIGEMEASIHDYRRTLELDPKNVETHVKLGTVLHALGRKEEAVESYQGALEAQSDSDEALVHLAEAFRHLNDPDRSDAVRDLLIRCFENPNVDSEAVISVSQTILKADLAGDLSSDSLTLNRIRELGEATDGLLLPHLRSGFVKDYDLEQFLCSVRQCCLRNADEIRQDSAGEGTYLPILEALAHQAFLNEYIWSFDDEESDLVVRLEADILGTIEDNEAPGATDLCLLASYRPLRDLEPIRSWAEDTYSAAPPGLRQLLERTVTEPELETEIRQRIEQLTTVDDAVSVSVRSQYEENPYPRWDSLSVFGHTPYTELILNSIEPNRPPLKAAEKSPKILIAGCGTGRHPIRRAHTCPEADILAVDLSTASLAYAQRKADSLGVGNIRFAQADILNLGSSEERFDVIECIGVLHHLAYPAAGLSVLTGLLKPGGLMYLGLYSASARAHVSRLREYIKDNNFESSLDGIRRFRGDISSGSHSDFEKISRSKEFYATSAIRDLLFHVQEHVLTIPQLQEMMEANKLELLGFSFDNPLVKRRFLERFPGDPNCLDLGNWHRFEQENPNMFIDMYKFWCRKLPRLMPVSSPVSKPSTPSYPT